MKKFLFVLLIVAFMFFGNNFLAVAGGHGHGIHWGYKGEAGPSHWGDLSSEYSACKQGKSQTPVNIAGAVKKDLKAIEFDYKDTPLNIINNGHTIQVNYTKGSSIVIDGKKFDLLQFHFHTPSENIVDGKHYDMEAHLVHKAKDGQLAVVAVFLKKGKKNDFIQKLWDNLPEEEGHANVVSNIHVNASSLLPADRSFYRFSGSLTTPPCSENVAWNVMKNPVEVSENQIAKFASFYAMNARPVQPLNGRTIAVSK